MFGEGFFSFSFTPNALVHSGLRGVGEAVKAKNENLLTGERVRDRTRAHVMREGARVRSLIGEGDGKVGRKEKEIGGGSEEDGVNEGGKEINGNRKVEQRMKKGKTRIGKAFTLCEKGSVAIIKGEISRRSARSVGKYREKQGKIEIRGWKE